MKSLAVTLIALSACTLNAQVAARVSQELHDDAKAIIAARAALDALPANPEETRKQINALLDRLQELRKGVTPTKEQEAEIARLIALLGKEDEAREKHEATIATKTKRLEKNLKAVHPTDINPGVKSLIDKALRKPEE